MRDLLVFAMVTVGLCLPSSSRAGGVAPSKPSDLRTLVGNNTACPGFGGNLRSVDLQSNPDGTTAALSIPKGKVFVVTSFDVQATGSAGATSEGGLFAANGTGSLADVARCGGIVGSNGFASASCTIPNGAAIKGGSTLCFIANAVLVHGFLAKDK